MIEIQKQLPLPVVGDRQPDAVPQLANHLKGVIDGKLPGVAIGQEGPADSHMGKHGEHQALVLQALQYLQPSVRASHAFDNLSQFLLSEATPMHVDNYFAAEMEPYDNKLYMDLRLHTTGTHGADVVMANTKPATFAGNIPDFRVTYYPELRQAHQYDDQPLHTVHQILETTGMGREYDPHYSEGTLYHHWQKTLSSVLFRTSAGMGPLTAHGFSPVAPDQPRGIITSDVTVYAQSL